MTLRLLAAVAAIALGSVGTAAPVLAPPATLGPDVQPFARVPAAHIALTHLDAAGRAHRSDAIGKINYRRDRRGRQEAISKFSAPGT